MIDGTKGGGGRGKDKDRAGETMLLYTIGKYQLFPEDRCLSASLITSGRRGGTGRVSKGGGSISILDDDDQTPPE